MNTKFSRMFLAATVCGLVAGPAMMRADEVTDAINEAVTAYNEKDYATATTALETAAQLVRQMRAQGFTAFLPPPPADWKAQPAESAAAGASMFGGMVSAQGEYTNAKTSGWARVQFIADSPVLQSYMMMLNMPMMASADGGKLVTIKRQKGILKYKPADKEGSLTIVVAGQLLIQIEGRSLTEAELRAFAEGIEFDKIMAAL